MTDLSRRRFLTGSAVAAGIAAVATGCAGDDTEDAGGAGDLRFAGRAAALEKLAVDTYATIRTAATQGRFGAAVPQALVEYLATAGSHHREHLAAWNRTLTAARRPAVDGPDPELRPIVDTVVARLTDIPAAAGAVLRIEDYASRTYLDAIPTLTGEDAIRTAARILVVDAQHQAVLRYLLGLEPVGSGTTRGSRGFPPSDPSPRLLTA